MLDKSKYTNPAVLRYRGLDLEAMTALQMRNVETLRSMTNLMFDTTEMVTRRQAEFLGSRADHISVAFEPGEGASDPKALFERQVEAYRDLFDALANHVGELAEITSKCCAGLVEEATGNMIDLPTRESPTERPEKKAGCCCGPSKKAVENEVESPIAESRTKQPANEGLAASKTGTGKSSGGQI
ncbi:MAG: hypothetical protein CMN55_15305 [Sneathiella sp.]|uniref:phasin family protein n=1 Tax=Sneathiella sp. TaxID=1964365 RepID=UPI000C4B8764|nr:phasin family protein [Sneathiella sp.]MAL80448.1 hypothetical protein [Sneathiella sp.]